jgi:hypothetical protein
MELHLGVIDIPYNDPDGSSTTTGDVAEFLEAKYHVMELFFIEHEQEIAEALAQAMANQIELLVKGAPAPANPFEVAEQQIFVLFDRFISTEEIAKINPDTPTQAAVEGRSKRRKGGKGPRRVSFRDTGQYMAAFRAWIEQGGSVSSSDLISAALASLARDA